jgi:lysophospholipase L1-like esterase
VTETPTNVTPPPDLTYGYVDGRIILAIGDRSDAGRMPDPVPADGMTVTLTPANTILKVASPTPATVVKQPIPCGVDANGYLIDGQAARGVWLVTGTYKVTYFHPRAMIPSHDIEVTTGHTEAAPLDLTTAMPPGGPVLTPSEYAELNGRLTILEAGSGVTDHGALTGLGEDDHTQYALADGTRGAFAAPLGADDNYVTDAEKAALHAHSNKAALDLVSGTNTGDQVLPTWSTISGKPAVVAAGATQADARTAIGAGTSSFSGAYADLTGKPTLGTAAATDATDYATTAQGVKADTAVQPADLTAYATTAGLYFPTPNAWIKWRGRRAAVMAATTQGHVAVVGDSIAFGAAGSGTTPPKYVTDWPGRLRALLAAQYGNAGSGVVIADANIRINPTWDDRFTYAGTITDIGFGFHAAANFRLDAVAGTYLEFTATADEFTVYNAAGAGGVINATVDGGAVKKLRNVYTGGAAVDIEKQAGYKQIVTKVPAGSVGVHTLRLTPDTSNATFDLFIHAVEGRVNTPGTFRVSNASINGKSLSTLFGGAGKNDEVNALYGLPMIDMLRADLLIIALGSNDWLSSTPAATAKTWLKALIQRQRAAGDNGNGSTYANGDALLVWNPQPDLTTLGLSTPSTWQAYRDMFYEVADEENVPLLDLGTRWNTYAAGNAAGFFGDGIHPNDAGSLDIAPAVRRAMFAEA